MTQDQEMAQLVAEMTLMSYGSTTAWNTSAATGKPGSRILSIEMLGEVAHEEFQARYNAARTDRSRGEVIADAKEALKVKRATHIAGETDAEQRDRCVRECEGLTASEAGTHMRQSVRWVMGARKARGRDVNTGKRLPVALRPPGRLTPGLSRADQAKALQRDGLTQEQVADRMGVSQPTVCRLLATRQLHRKAA